MKVRVEVDPDMGQNEVIIRCKSLDDATQRICKELELLLSRTESDGLRLTLYRGSEAFYLLPNQILFFETCDGTVFAHTAAEMYRSKSRLYELEQLLPGEFIRISKSTIINTQHVRSVKHNLASASLVQFHNSHKQVYVSRNYYHILRDKLENRTQE